MIEFIFERYNYWAIIFLMMIGLYVTFQAGNMIKRMMGLGVFQTSVFLFYNTLGKVKGGTAPILYGRDASIGHGEEHGDGHEVAGHADAGHGAPADAHGEAAHAAVVPHSETDALGRPFVEGFLDPAHPAHEVGQLQELYSNPIPHVLILTAIVVGVATLAVGLAIIVRIREAYGTIEMDEVREADLKTATEEASAETA